MAQPAVVASTEDAQEIQALVARAHAAQAQIADYTQDQVNELIKAMVWSCCQPGVAEKLAQASEDWKR